MREITEHENVIKLHETFEGENTFYFVMELIEGTSLYDEIKNHSKEPFKEKECYDMVK